MNPDWDGRMKAQALKPKGPIDSARLAKGVLAVADAVALLDRVLEKNHAPATYRAWQLVRKALLA